MSLNILQWNIRGYLGNRPYLLKLIDSVKPTIITLQETHMQNHNNPYLPGYQAPIAFKNRINRRGGGVSIFTLATLPSVALDIDTPLEAAAVKVFINSKPLTICSLYIPPDLPLSDITEPMEKLISDLPVPLIICMDSNAHYYSWGSNSSDSRGNFIAELIDKHSLIILNTGEPTFLSSNGTYTHIDLTLCSPQIASQIQWLTHPDFSNSDHLPIVIGTDILLSTSTESPRWQLSKANWSSFRAALTLPESFLSPTQACGTFTHAIITAAKTAIPLSQSCGRHKSAYWWNEKCSEARRNMRKALTRYKNHKGSIQLWVNYKQSRAIFRHTTLKAQKESWLTFLSNFKANTTSTQIWQHIRRLRSKRTTRQVIIKDNDKLITDPAEVADCLAVHFSKMSSGQYCDPIFNQHKAVEESEPISFPPDHSPSYNSALTMEELALALSTSNSRTPGPDDIPYDFMQNFSPDQLKSLLHFYNYIFDNGYPHQWREGVTIAIPKANQNRCLKTSQRPITLLSCLSKLMEKIINRRLQEYLETINFYNPTQSGFRANHCTLDNLCRLEYHAQMAIFERKYCVAVFLDISKAFDRVWHHGLLSKLKQLGLCGKLANFIKGFLLSRRIKVRTSGATSPSYTLGSGVPQGSVLSPTLFTIFVNDIFDGLPQGVESSLYADDGAIWTTSDSLIEAITTLQSAIIKIEEWTHTWGLTISPAKTTALIFTNRRINSPPPLLLENTAVPYVSHHKFLGITYDTRLTWTTHIKSIKERCQKDLQLLKVISYNKWGADYPSLHKLYSALILPKLEYGCIIYSNAAPSNLAILDRIQFAAARILLGALRCTPTAKLEAEADLMPLHLRRQQHLAQYGSRILTISNHPTKELYNNFFPLQDYFSNKYKLPAMGRLLNELRDLSLDKITIPSTQMKLRYSTSILPAYSSLATHPKNMLTSKQWQNLHKQLLRTKYKNHNEIYTDGSLSADHCGCAVWNSNFSIKVKLPSFSTIFTAELYAILLALKFISGLPGPFIIFTDSLSAVAAIKSLRLSHHYLLHWIHQSFMSLPPNHAKIEWIPSHSNIEGNESADRLAVASRSLPTVTNIPPSKLEMQGLIKDHYKKKWTQTWQALPQSITNFKPVLAPTTFRDSPRCQQVQLTRLRLSTCYITHKHFFQKTPPAKCSQCKCQITTDHIFITCPKYSQERNQLKMACRENNLPFNMKSLLGGQIVAEDLCRYLKSINLLHMI